MLVDEQRHSYIEWALDHESIGSLIEFLILHKRMDGIQMIYESWKERRVESNLDTDYSVCFFLNDDGVLLQGILCKVCDRWF